MASSPPAVLATFTRRHKRHLADGGGGGGAAPAGGPAPKLARSGEEDAGAPLRLTGGDAPWARVRGRTPLREGAANCDGGDGDGAAKALSAGGAAGTGAGRARSASQAVHAALLAKRAYFQTVDAEARCATPRGALSHFRKHPPFPPSCHPGAAPARCAARAALPRCVRSALTPASHTPSRVRC
jgi:hypothetical protein